MYKKSLCFMVMVACVLMFASFSFAEDVLSTDGTAGELNIGSNANSTALAIGLSPKVVARYVTDGTTAVTAQWYAVAAAHPGGNAKYCTGQNLNNIGTASYATGTALDNTILNIPTTKDSEDAFAALGWDFD